MTYTRPAFYSVWMRNILSAPTVSNGSCPFSVWDGCSIICDSVTDGFFYLPCCCCSLSLSLTHTHTRRWWMELGVLCPVRFTLCAGPQHAVQHMEPNNSLGCKPDQWGRLLASHQRQRYAHKSLRSCSRISFVLSAAAPAVVCVRVCVCVSTSLCCAFYNKQQPPTD